MTETYYYDADYNFTGKERDAATGGNRGEPGTDGTFPLFRENVNRESMPFFEGQPLTYPRPSRSSS